MDHPPTFLVRVWLPDRPGALAAVTGRLGALKGDVLALEIVERRNGLAIDEIVVALPPTVSVDLIAKEVGQVDDVEIEDIRRLEETYYDPQLDALEAAALIVEASTREELAQMLCQHLRRTVRADWACVLDAGGVPVGSWGDRPNDRWVDSFVSGSPPCDSAARLPEMEAVWLPLPAAQAALVVGRGTAIRGREQARLSALARVADAQFRSLARTLDQEAHKLHPSQG